MATAQVAEQRRVPPSELMGITCEFCAYCFDEAMIVRKAALQAEAERKAENAQRGEEHRDKLSTALRAVPGV